MRRAEPPSQSVLGTRPWLSELLHAEMILLLGLHELLLRIVCEVHFGDEIARLLADGQVSVSLHPVLLVLHLLVHVEVFFTLSHSCASLLLVDVAARA